MATEPIHFVEWAKQNAGAWLLCAASLSACRLWGRNAGWGELCVGGYGSEGGAERRSAGEEGAAPASLVPPFFIRVGARAPLCCRLGACGVDAGVRRAHRFGVLWQFCPSALAWRPWAVWRAQLGAKEEAPVLTRVPARLVLQRGWRRPCAMRWSTGRATGW